MKKLIRNLFMIGKIQAKRKKPDAEEPLIGLWSAFSLKPLHYNGEGCINTFPSIRDYRSNYPWRFSKKTNLRASALRIACLFRYVRTLCYSQKIFTAYQFCVASPLFRSCRNLPIFCLQRGIFRNRLCGNNYHDRSS